MNPSFFFINSAGEVLLRHNIQIKTFVFGGSRQGSALKILNQSKKTLNFVNTIEAFYQAIEILYWKPMHTSDMI